MQEQKSITGNECPNCGCKEQTYMKRTKGSMTYIVYVCKNCKVVIRRKIG